MPIRVSEFDVWQARYGGAVVEIKNASDDSSASVYYDTALTYAAANPQTLQSYQQGGVSFDYTAEA